VRLTSGTDLEMTEVSAMYQSYLQSREDTSDAGNEHPSHTSLDVEMPERLTHRLETDVLLRPGFRWRPQLSRGHNKVYSPPGGGEGAKQGKGQEGFLIILALHYNTF